MLFYLLLYEPVILLVPEPVSVSVSVLVSVSVSVSVLVPGTDSS